MENSLDFSQDSLHLWLINHQEFIQFIKFDSPDDPLDKNLRKEIIFHTLGLITHFYHYRLLSSGPQRPEFPKLGRDIPKLYLKLARIHLYIQWKLYRIRCKLHQESINKVDELIEVLKDSMNVDTSQIIVVNTQLLFLHLLNDSKRSTQMAMKDFFIINCISSDEYTITNQVSSQRAHIHQVIFAMKPSFDRRTMNIGYHPLQDRFEQLIFSDSFIFREEIQHLISETCMTDPHSFTSKVVDLLQKIIRVFQFNDSFDVSILSIIFFRAIFDEAYSVFPEFFSLEVAPKFRCVSPYITINMIGASLEYLPIHNEDDSIKTIVLKNKHLLQASGLITELAFYNTPLDVLGGIYSVLSEIRLYTSSLDSDGALSQSFDCIFGLFLLVITASDIANIEEVLWFANEFSPSDGLSGPFEYSKATVAASLVQCSSIVKSLVGK